MLISQVFGFLNPIVIKLISGFQKWIGFEDIKSSPTYFYVQRNSTFNQTQTPIPFEIEKVNIGGAMNLQTGKFMAPRSGTYFFSLSGIAYIPVSSTRLGLWIGLYVNGIQIGRSHADDSSNTVVFETYSQQSTLNLQAGDLVWIEISTQSTGVYLHDDVNHYTNFNGWLLQEHISNSLNTQKM
jgi:hypothetical protein